MTYDSSYYEAIRGRLHAILWEVSDRLSESTRTFVIEELDANELGLALEAMVDELEEARTPLTSRVVGELQDLARTMGMDIDVARRLDPLVPEDMP